MSFLQKEKSFKNVLTNLDKNIVNYKSQSFLFDFPKKLTEDKSKQYYEEEKTFYDLLSKYQFHNSNLQYENYYLKEQNKYLEKEIKNFNDKYLKVKIELEHFNNKLNKIEKIKENNLKDINQNNKGYLTINQSEKNFIYFLNNKKDFFLKLGINLDSKSKDEINLKLIETILEKLISEHLKLNKKIEELKSIIKQLNSNLKSEKEMNKHSNSNNNLEKYTEKNKLKFPEKKNITIEQTKENTISTERNPSNKIISQIHFKPSTPKSNEIKYNEHPFKSFSQLSSNIKNNNQNNFLNNNSNPETKTISSYNMFKRSYNQPIKTYLTKKDKLKNKFIITKKNPLFGLKTKIELLESMIKEANLSQNDNYSESISFSNNQSRNLIQETNY